ncbi:MAG: DUF3467 domain-containing protein [Pirellula sp.]|jgi:hypothetical protein
MTFPNHPDDRPDPMENMPAVRARIPEHVAKGEISTGVIVVTGPTEYVLDFVRNLPRPNCIVARVVLPHLVMPQFIDALSTNVQMFRNRYGDLPGAVVPPTPTNPTQQDSGDSSGENSQPAASMPEHGIPGSGNQLDLNAPFHSDPPQNSGVSGSSNQSPPASDNPFDTQPIEVHPGAPLPQMPAQQNNITKRQNPQDVYDDLKLRDEILSGAYANAVMIGHGPFEFSFDFITNFYPQSAVSSRVYMASGHVLRLLDSLKASWEQIRGRYGHPPKP